MSKRSRAWVFTRFFASPPPAGENAGKELLTQLAPLLTYGCCQLEICPETERLHIQGYLYFPTVKSMRQVQQIMMHGLGLPPHLEPARGSPAQNKDYCSKQGSAVPGTFYETGEIPARGSRSDLHDIAKSVMQCRNLDTVVESHPEVFVKYSKGLKALLFEASRKMARVTRALKVIVLHGGAGTGKTRLATTILPVGERDYFILDRISNDTIWFDGYNGEGTLIIDDFYGWCPHSMLLRILDMYPFRCPIKGAFTWAAWTQVIITSNKHPKEWYEKFDWRDDDALRRRIHEIYEVKSIPLVNGQRCELYTGALLYKTYDFTNFI